MAHGTEHNPGGGERVRGAMFESVPKKQRRRVSIVEVAVVTGILVILAAIAVTLVSYHQDRPRGPVSTTSQAPQSTIIKADVPPKLTDRFRFSRWLSNKAELNDGAVTPGPVSRPSRWRSTPRS